MLCVFKDFPLLFLSVHRPTAFIVNFHFCTVNKDGNFYCLKSFNVDTSSDPCNSIEF